jgi:Ubiquitin 3 binding protein But2 C-terminal domain
VDSAHPSTAYGTQFNGKVCGTVASIFNFDIPPSYSGMTCSLVFLFPTQSQLTTSSYTISGAGGIDFSLLSSVATQSTDYDNRPGVAADYGVVDVQPGNSYVVATFPCQAGEAVSYELASEGTCLEYFQDFNPSPIGLYITAC